MVCGKRGKPLSTQSGNCWVGLEAYLSNGYRLECLGGGPRGWQIAKLAGINLSRAGLTNTGTR